ncbi:hypothetical protein FB446DRAFT_706938 [Lentinula raphanica]|nr:hypothetical protein FB446DRAFT_706938 [Lentinula raphanica]
MLAVWQGGASDTPHSIAWYDCMGFRYKICAVYAHFPINCIIQNEGRAVEIRTVGSGTVVAVTPQELLGTSPSRSSRENGRNWGVIRTAQYCSTAQDDELRSTHIEDTYRQGNVTIQCHHP